MSTIIPRGKAWSHLYGQFLSLLVLKVENHNEIKVRKIIVKKDKLCIIPCVPKTCCATCHVEGVKKCDKVFTVQCL